MASNNLSPEEQEFMAKCEEEFKDRYTEKDEDFMKVYNTENSKPPIVDPWWVSNNFGRRNDRRDNRRAHPYVKYRNRDQYERQSYRRGYNDYNQQYDNAFGHRNQQPRYYD